MDFKLESIDQRWIIGVDEVGRGCLAGDVFAAAVVYDRWAPNNFLFLNQIKDSKQLTASQRETLSLEIKKNYICKLGQASVQEIDQINILQASLLAMKRAVLAAYQDLHINGTQDGFRSPAQWSDCHLLIDGLHPIKVKAGEEFCLQQTCLVKGDQRALPVAMASIYAKVQRDHYMRVLAESLPAYGFENHKGYGTKAHKKSIEKVGPSPYHRRSFAGVKEYC